MRGVLLLTTAALCAALHGTASAQDAVRFDRPVFTTAATVLCARQGDIAALRRASDDNDRAAFERIASTTCKLAGPDIRLSVVAKPGLLDPDVEVRVNSAPGTEANLPRGKVWTLKTMVRN
jgi:hypothetical protein